jgi:type IV secretory pathway component VirB8
MPVKIFYNEILSKEESENRINVLLTIFSVALSTFLLALIIIVIALLPKSPKIVQVQTAAKTKQGLLFTYKELYIFLRKI